ncbi:hypothetical protein FOPE_11827 [Fonsecaea pedrosoi]|nr:hypothetical protein FOPE_11827 [Fonsecaea pedrosoi]
MCYTQSTLFTCPDCGARRTSADHPEVDKFCSSSNACSDRNRRPLPHREVMLSKRCSRCRDGGESRHSHVPSTRQGSASVVRESVRESRRSQAQSTASRTWTIDSNTSTIRDNRERALIPATTTAGSRSRRETSRYDDRDGPHVAHERGDYGSSLSRSRTVSTTARSRGDGRRDNRDGDSSVVELSDLFGSMSMANTSSSRRSYCGDSGHNDTPALSLITLFTCTRHSVAQCPNTVGAEARRRAATDDHRPSRPARHEIPFRRLLAHHDVKRRDVKMTYHEQDHEIDLELPDWFLTRVPPGNLVCRDDGVGEGEKEKEEKEEGNTPTGVFELDSRRLWDFCQVVEFGTYVPIWVTR